MPLQPMVTGRRFMVSAGHWLATEAGHAVLAAGGNAVDAAAAAGIALGVVHCDQVQCSGVAPMVIRMAETGEVVTISGLGWWPRAARVEHFEQRHGGAIPPGPLRTVVPAAPDAWILALSRFGTMSFAEVASFAIRYAREGFTVHPVMAHFIGNFAEQYRMWPQNAAVFLPGGTPPQEGDLFVQADLARSLQFMADEERAALARGADRLGGLAAARDAFYRGDLAAAMARFYAENGGWLTREDLAEYRSAIEPPVRRDIHGTEVYSCGPWCQGPVLLQFRWRASTSPRWGTTASITCTCWRRR
jgi:gamma-glutamyltranspeptidase/glutathione hydrolase